MDRAKVDVEEAVIGREHDSEMENENAVGGDAGRAPRVKARRWWVAALFSLLQPGLGQVYNGQWKKAIFLYVGVYLALGALGVGIVVRYPSLRGLIAGLVMMLAGGGYFLWDAIVIARKEGSHYTLKRCNKIWIYVLVYLAGMGMYDIGKPFIVKNFIQAFKIPSSGMGPTLLSGDFLLSYKARPYLANLKQGDVVTFLYPVDTTKDWIKRIAAVGGDTVEIRKKQLFVNGAQADAIPAIYTDQRRPIPAEASPRDNFGPVKVPADSFFMLGDNRDRSLDSRFWGFVHRSQVTGVAKVIYFSWDRESARIRWERIGKQIQ